MTDLTLTQIILLYFAVINVATFFTYGLDKHFLLCYQFRLRFDKAALRLNVLLLLITLLVSCKKSKQANGVKLLAEYAHLCLMQGMCP